MATAQQMKSRGEQVLDGSDIMGLVENEEAFAQFVDRKFKELDVDEDGKLSVRELQPAVADIGAALGLPSKGSSPDSDHIYDEVLSEFTRGKQEKVGKTEFKTVLSDILLGMATGLQRDPIVILRIDGEDLLEFADSTRFEAEAIGLFSQVQSTGGSVRDCITKALAQLSVEHGLPPSSDSWVFSNVIEPALQSCSADHSGNPISQEVYLEEFKKVLKNIAARLKEQPVIVAHTENTFDGSGIKRLLSNKFELDKLLDAAVSHLPKDHHGKESKKYIRVALDEMAPSAGLPPYGAVGQIDAIVDGAIKMVGADDGKLVDGEEFKKLLKEVLGSIMLQLEATPVSVSLNSVVHEPLANASGILGLAPTESSSAPESG